MQPDDEDHSVLVLKALEGLFIKANFAVDAEAVEGLSPGDSFPALGQRCSVLHGCIGAMLLHRPADDGLLSWLQSQLHALGYRAFS